jgi:hypothetical protein
MASQIGMGTNGMKSGISTPGVMPTSISPGIPPSLDPFQLETSFQQPFVPQDLWQMPMTLEWDWADMTSGFLGMGNSFDPSGNGLNGTASGAQK